MNQWREEMTSPSVIYLVATLKADHNSLIGSPVIVLHNDERIIRNVSLPDK